VPYHFPEPLRSQIDAFADDDAGSVTPELAITRFLIQQSVSDGKAPLCNALLSTAAKLSSVEIANRVRAGALLERSAVVHLAQLMAAAVSRRLAGVPNFESISDALTGDFREIIHEQKRLTHEPAGDSPRDLGS
jgi:hypothetical protein